MSREEPKGVTGYCDCGEMHRAKREGRMLPSVDGKGWHLTDAPARYRSWNFTANNYEYALEDHTGERYCFVTCPFCGHDLEPSLPDPPIIRFESQGDGDGPE